MFTQGDVDKRGVKIMRDGKPVQLSDFHEGDRLSATIITSKPPKVMTEKEVNATLATAKAAAAAAPAAAAPAPSARGRAAPAAARHLRTTRHGGHAGTCGHQCISGTGAAGRGPDAAEDRQLVAVPRARERPVARDRARPDYQAPLRQLGDML